MPKLPFFAILPIVLLLGCGSDGQVTANEGGDEPRGTGPGDWSAGDYPPDLMGQSYLELDGADGREGVTRQYKVHVPANYDPAVPMPVVFCLHGLQQNAVMFCVSGSNLVSKSDTEGFILVMPNGDKASWNAGGCCKGDPDPGNDVAFVRAVFDEVKKHVNVDLDRVYATGLSNGGFMSYRLACEAADIFAAVAPGAGALTTNGLGWGATDSDFVECTPSEHVSVLDIHGTADGIVPYELQARSLELISQKNGCGSATAPSGAPRSAGDTTCVSYTGCPDGVEVTGCTVEGGGHVWFGSDSCGTGAGAFGCSFVGANSTTMVNTDEVWDFFARRSK
jgi:polyhydroxybutyrate depolymerase